ncbi:MAG: hypothetical protein R6V05_05565 [Candidatus Brocadiia bacterium]
MTRAMVTVAALLLLGGSMVRPERPDTARIRIHPGNPFHWEYAGEPLLLLGGSSEDNLFQVPEVLEELDALAEAGGNYVRCTMSSRDEGNAWPFVRDEDLYDLTRLNPEYWRRFETFLDATEERGIIVQIELWATFDFYRGNWARNPFNPAMNINYSAEESGLPVEVNSHPVKTENPFFWSVLAEDDRRVVLRHQERFVDEVLARALPHANVLYCMDNETSVTPEWGRYWSEYVKRAAAEAGVSVQTTEMWDPHDLDHPMHRATFDHPETYSFVDISQNNHNTGRAHYEGALKVRRMLAETTPRPMNCVKTYGADTGRYGSTRDGAERFWRNIFAGVAAVRFHRPGSGIGASDLALRMVRSAREVTDALDLVRCQPAPELLDAAGDKEVYCLAEPGRQYALYFPAPNQATLDLSDAPQAMGMRWYDIDGGTWREAEPLGGGTPVALQPPGEGQWAAVVTARRER